MGDYAFVCILLFSMILACRTWPRETRENSHNQQSFIPKTDDTSPSQTSFRKRELETMRGDPEDLPIVYPGQRIDYSAEGKGFNCVDNICENATDYPYKRIQEVIPLLSRYRNLFGAVEGIEVNIGNRLSPSDPELKPLCETLTYTSYPKTMKNERNITKFIVNDGEYKQGMVFEKCIEKAVCGDATFPTGYEAKCEQKYSSRRLMAIEADAKGEPAFDTFVIPSCCVCVVKKLKKN